MWSRRDKRDAKRREMGQDTGKEGTEQRAEEGRVRYGEYEERVQTLGTTPEDDGNGSQDMAIRTDDGEGIGEERVEETLLDACAIGWITQEDLPGGTIIVDDRNEFNKMSHLKILWMV